MSPHGDRQVSGGGAPALDRIALAHAAGLPLDRVEVVETIASTNQALLDRPPDDFARGPALLVAAHQSLGRGRRGRGWHSPPGASLALSVAQTRPRAPASKPLTGLSLALGVAVAETLSQQVPGIGLKWPNDLMRDGRKAGGMLIEIRHAGEAERIVIGLGVNLRVDDTLAQAVDQPVAGLFDGAARVPPREALAGALGRALAEGLRRFLAEGFADTAMRWARYDVLAGREVTVYEHGVPILSGRADGIAPGGALRVRTAHGVQEVAAGDVSVRPGTPGRPAAGPAASVGGVGADGGIGADGVRASSEVRS